MIDLEDDVFQAECQISYLRRNLEDGGTIDHVRDDVVTMLLSDGSETTINLRPIQHLLSGLRSLT